MLDIDNPKFREGLERLREINEELTAAQNAAAWPASFKRAWLGARAAVAFLRLFLLRPEDNELPASSRLAPAW